MRVLVWLVTLLILAGDASAQNGPSTWTAVHSEVLSVRKGEVPVALSYDEGLRLRHFHLRLSASHPFDAKLVRAHDGTILFSGRRDSKMETLVDWGRGEIAHLTIEPRGRQTLQVVLEIAGDPRDEGLEVYSFQVNRFLRLYESGERELAKRALENALNEDSDDSMAAALLARVWKSEGITTPPREIESESETEGVWDEIAADQHWRRVRGTLEQVWRTAGADCRAPRSPGRRRGRRRWHRPDREPQRRPGR